MITAPYPIAPQLGPLHRFMTTPLDADGTAIGGRR